MHDDKPRMSTLKVILIILGCVVIGLGLVIAIIAGLLLALGREIQQSL